MLTHISHKHILYVLLVYLTIRPGGQHTDIEVISIPVILIVVTVPSSLLDSITETSNIRNVLDKY